MSRARRKLEKPGKLKDPRTEAQIRLDLRLQLEYIHKLWERRVKESGQHAGR